jgi:hypothetical protein
VEYLDIEEMACIGRRQGSAMLKAMEAIEKRVVLKSEEAVERNAVLRAVQENAAVGVVDDDIEEMLKDCCCMWVHVVEDPSMRRGYRFTQDVKLCDSRGSKYDLHDTPLPADEVVGRGLEPLVVLTAAKSPHLNNFKQNITKN